VTPRSPFAKSYSARIVSRSASPSPVLLEQPQERSLSSACRLDHDGSTAPYSSMSRGAAPVSPEEFILSVLSPEDRLEAAFAVAREAFRGSTLTLDDIEAAVRKVRRRRVSAGRRGRAGRR
jgi:hypothetical protein